jgi:hypothetical protein
VSRFLLIVASLVAALAAGAAEGQELQRGKLKKLDLARQLAVVTIDGRDHALALSDETQVAGKPSGTLAEKLAGLREGSDVVVRIGERGGRRIVQGIGLAEAGRRAAPQPGNSGGGPLSAKVKALDVRERLVTLNDGEKDVVFAVTEWTQLRGVSGRTVGEKLRNFEPGDDVVYAAAERDGRQVLLGMMSVKGPDGPPVSPEHAGLKPLDELGTAKYQGYTGGFYPGGRNARPGAHEAAGVKLAAEVRPRDAAGRPDPAGMIVLLSVGMSNTAQASQGFEKALAGYAGKNPRLVFVNGAQGAMTAAAIQDPDDGGRGTQYWSEIDERLKQAGATRAQVQAIWIKEADPNPDDGFPDHARRLQLELMRIVQLLAQRFANAKLVYLTSRSYGGFATVSLNPEPYAYESGFAVKWLIAEQLRGNPALNHDPARGAVTSPWLSWGPYLWANGKARRSADGFSWHPEDFAGDGTHLSASGQRKAGRLLLDFFKSDPTTRGWFTGQPATSRLQQERGHQHPLDLGGARVELAAERVAQLALDLVFGHVAVAAVDLQGVLGALHPVLADDELGQRGLDKDALALRAQPRGAVKRGARFLQPHLHVDDLGGDELELADGLAELLAFPRITDAGLEQALHRADRAREDAAALPGHGVVEERHAAALRPEPVLHRDLAVLEE